MLLPKRNRTLARNSHLVPVAARTLTAVTPIIQQHNANSFSVSSFPVLVYRRFTSGLPCSCTERHPASEDAVRMYDDNGNASPEVMLSILNASTFQIEEYNPEGRHLDNSQDIDSSRTVSNDDAGINVDPDAEVQDVPVSPVGSYFGGACGVCFGTGYKGGYYPLGAERLVFDYRNISDAYGVSIDKLTYPYAIQFESDDAWVDFSIPNRGLPRYSSGGPTTTPSVLNLWNNGTLLESLGTTPNVSIKSQLPGSAWFLYNTFKGRLPNEGFTIRVRRSDLLSDAMTHLEMVTVSRALPFYVDVPNLTRTFDPSKPVPYGPTTLEAPASLPLLHPWDVVADAVHQVLWLVTSSKATSPSSLANWAQTLEVSPLEPQWLQARLTLPTPGWLNAPERGWKNTPGFQLPYSRRGGF